jgi:anti-sigma factor RsiW
VNHHRAGRLLSAYVDAELSAAEAREVQEHLLDCAACREAYERLRAARSLLAGLPPAEPPAEFWAAVREPVLRGEYAAVAGGLPPDRLGARVRDAWRSLVRRRWLVVRRPGWALAAVVLMLALATVPLVKGTVDRLHATEIGVDLYVHDHAVQMGGAAPLVDRAYVGLVAGDAELVIAGENPRTAGGSSR